MALRIFCRDTTIQHREQLRHRGPLLVVANHPNSFLDAIIIGAHFRHTVHFLARGDVFQKPRHSTMLRLLNMIPVYRMSEGKQNLHRNEDAFSRCKQILSKNGIVLIFIEGICVNKHEMQPFKKGAARIAIENGHLPGFQILPLGIAYDSLKAFGKKVRIDIAAPVPAGSLLPYDDDARNMRHFNEQLFEKISALIHVPSIDNQPGTAAKKSLLVPALIGRILHIPLYTVIKQIVWKKTTGTVFYDSVLFGALLMAYPIYLLLIVWLLACFSFPVSLVLLVLVLHPFTAWAAVQVHKKTARDQDSSQVA